MKFSALLDGHELGVYILFMSFIKYWIDGLFETLLAELFPFYLLVKSRLAAVVAFEII